MRIFIIASALLSGCTTIASNPGQPNAAAAVPTTAAELRQRPPAAVYRTSKTPPVLAQCLVERFPLLSRFAATEAGNRHTLQFNENGVMRMLVDLEDGALTVWRLLPYDADARRKFESCL